MIPILHQPFGFMVQNGLPGNPIAVQLIYHLTPANDEIPRPEIKKNSKPKLRIV